MRQRRSIQWVLFLLFALLAVFGGGCGGGSSSHSSSDGGGNTATVEGAIERVSTLAFMDVDGPKVQAIVVEYDVELPSGSVDTSTYEVFSYANLPKVFDVGTGNGWSSSMGGSGSDPFTTYPAFGLQNGTPGAATKVYVSSTGAIDPSGNGDSSGKYVIIELNTDYQLAAVSADWRACVAGGVKQVLPIEAGNISVSPSDDVVGNYEPGYFWDINPMGSNHSVTLQKVFDDTAYVLKGLEGYKIYTDDVAPAHVGVSPSDPDKAFNVPDATVLSKVVGSSFVANHCFSEYVGDYVEEVHLMYSLFVPADYEAQKAAGKKFALAFHFEDAGALGDDPMLALTEAQAAANYASDRVQQIVKDQGLGGLIVVLPQVPKAGQTVRDNLTGNEYIPAVWQLLDYLTSTYAIDPNRIYGSGQSMGGMSVLNMAAQRDNYFAGIWSIGSQWASQYLKEGTTYQGASTYKRYPDDSPFITNPNWENWYWSLSDDNILVTNMTGDGTATAYWQKLVNFYSTLAGKTIPKVEWDALAIPKAAQSTLLQYQLLAMPNDTNIYWNALTGGSHNATWIYAHAVSYSYDWLLSQTKASEDARGKLDVLGQEYVAPENWANPDVPEGGTLHYSYSISSGGGGGGFPPP
jgi:predicted peptidase